MMKEIQKSQIKRLPVYSIKKARLNTSLLLSRTRNKKVVYFEVSVKDQVKIHENYKIVQSQVNEVEKIKAEIDRNNPVSQFILGAVDGVKDNLVGTATMIAHPLETLGAIKDVAVALSSLTAEDVGKIAEAVKGKIKDTFTTRDGINSIPYGAGYAVGMIATDIVIGKGVGIALEAVKEIPAIKNLLTKLGDLKSLATAKVAEKFSDEAASLASQRARKALATTVYSGIPVDAMLDMAVVAGNKIKNGAVKFADFSKQMVDEFGDKIKPHLAKLHREGLISLDLKPEFINAAEIEKFLGKAVKKGDKLPEGYHWNKDQIHRDNGNVDANFAKLQVDENGKIALSEVERLSNPNTMNKNFLGKVRAEYSTKGLKGEALENAVKAEKARVQVHHLIPDEVVRNSEFGKVAQKAGYNLDEGSNLLGLPRKAENILEGETGHWTNHPEYSKYVTNKLKDAKKELELKYKKPVEQIDKKIILKKMKRLEKEFEKYIKSGNAPRRPDGSLAKLDTQKNKTLTFGGRYEVRV